MAIALAMSVLGGLLLVTWNMERLLARWTTSAEFSVYLRDDATSEQRGVIETLIDQSGAAAGRDYVSKEQALVRFRREFADLASTAAGVGDNPFPGLARSARRSAAPRPTAVPTRCCGGSRRCRAWPTSATIAPGCPRWAPASTRCAAPGWCWRC